MNQDHKSLVDAFLKWYKTDPHHENRNAYPELKSSVYLEGLNKEDFIEYFFQFVKEGGGIQGGGQRGAGEFKIAIARDFENFRSFVLEPYGNKLDLGVCRAYRFKPLRIAYLTLLSDRGPGEKPIKGQSPTGS